MAIEKMDEARKGSLGICSFLPLAAFLLAIGYHLTVFKKQVAGKEMEDHIALATETYHHFTQLAVAYGAASLITLVVLLYFLVHLLRLKHMSAGTKLIWAVAFTLAMPVSLPVFWYRKIRREPEQLDVYPEL